MNRKLLLMGVTALTLSVFSSSQIKAVDTEEMALPTSSSSRAAPVIPSTPNQFVGEAILEAVKLAVHIGEAIYEDIKLAEKNYYPKKYDRVLGQAETLWKTPKNQSTIRGIATRLGRGDVKEAIDLCYVELMAMNKLYSQKKQHITDMGDSAHSKLLDSLKSTEIVLRQWYELTSAVAMVGAAYKAQHEGLAKQQKAAEGFKTLPGLSVSTIGAAGESSDFVDAKIENLSEDARTAYHDFGAPPKTKPKPVKTVEVTTTLKEIETEEKPDGQVVVKEVVAVEEPSKKKTGWQNFKQIFTWEYWHSAKSSVDFSPYTAPGFWDRKAAERRLARHITREIVHTVFLKIAAQLDEVCRTALGIQDGYAKLTEMKTLTPAKPKGGTPTKPTGGSTGGKPIVGPPGPPGGVTMEIKKAT